MHSSNHIDELAVKRLSHPLPTTRQTATLRQSSPPQLMMTMPPALHHKTSPVYPMRMGLFNNALALPQRMSISFGNNLMTSVSSLGQSLNPSRISVRGRFMGGGEHSAFSCVSVGETFCYQNCTNNTSKMLTAPTKIDVVRNMSAGGEGLAPTPIQHRNCINNHISMPSKVKRKRAAIKELCNVHPSLAISKNDVSIAHEFISKGIKFMGENSGDVPTQKQYLTLGMTTTKQQKARRFLRASGAIVVTTRTQISAHFSTLGDIQLYLDRAFPLHTHSMHYDDAARNHHHHQSTSTNIIPSSSVTHTHTQPSSYTHTHTPPSALNVQASNTLSHVRRMATASSIPQHNDDTEGAKNVALDTPRANHTVILV